MLKSFKAHPLSWFLLAWTLVNLLQAGTTELLDDEAYYWVYSRFPDWGYFDHPPMIALCIRAGYALFPWELGVRFLMVLMSTLTIWIIHSLLLVKNNRLFFQLVLCLGVLQIGGILAVPDIPLTFFTALFFWQLKRFLEKNTLAEGLLLGLVMALMLYSKYHGVLIILFSLLACPRLLRQPNAWVAALFGALLFLPHLWWQYQHGFPSVWYHLRERNAPAYKINFTLEYILGQFLLAGPLVGWLLLYAAGRFRPRAPFEKALLYSLVGFYGFFLLSSFKGRVEANWTVPALVPLLILSHAWLNENRWQVWIRRLWLPTLILVLVARMYMMTDIPFLTSRIKDEMHGNKEWAGAIQERAGGLPVVFMDKYQRPSKYWFYSGDTAFVLNSTTYRRNNYNFWPIEKQLQGRRVYFADNILHSDSAAVPIPNPREPLYGKPLPNFYSYSGIRIEPAKLPLEISGGQLLAFDATVAGEVPGARPVLDVVVGNDVVARIPLSLRPEGDPWKLSSSEPVTIAPGKYRCKLGMLSVIPGIATQISPAMELVAKP